MIKLLVLDVDGTLTNGQLTYDTNGVETKSFSVKDGLAIASWTKKLRLKIAIITGRNSPIVEKRAKELGVQYIYQGIHNKDEILETILEKENITFENVASIGDDLNDYKMLKKSKLSFCPSDAVKEVRDMVNIVCSKAGGDGAVREMIEYILKYEDKEDEILKLWL
ncbi:MAG: HAD hydrolase family protein [Arcobacteraceae bacterium]|nr:HAD hydrolase family protein [Arcobacteraceae bacterium]